MSRVEDEDAREGREEPAPRIRRRGRRVTTEPSAGYIGEPPAEEHDTGGENDERLRQDKPPHWG